jgi:hypothetical protein
MTTYVTDFSDTCLAEGNLEIATAIEKAAQKGSAKPLEKQKAAYEAAFMGTSGHAMTSVIVIKKD